MERKRRRAGDGNDGRGGEAGETWSGGTGPWNVHARKRATSTHLRGSTRTHGRAHTDAEREPMRLSRGRRAETGTGKAAGWSVRNEPRGGQRESGSTNELGDGRCERRKEKEGGREIERERE